MRSRRWVVDERSPQRLDRVLDAMGVEADALVQGRVFVCRKRAESASIPLRLGDTVEVFAVEHADVHHEEPAVLAREGGLIAAYKPSGMPTIPDHRGSAGCLQAFVAAQMGRADLAGVHPTSRLDVKVSGVVVFALTERARNLLREAREQRRYRRHYVALSSSAPNPSEGIVDVPIGRGTDARTRQVRGRQAVACQTRYRAVSRGARGVLIAAEPLTGRTHQIRVHMAHLGAPLVGDGRYGGKHELVLPSGEVRSVDRIALHAAWVEIGLPRSQHWMVRARVPEQLRELWTALGGDSVSLEDSLQPIDMGA